MGKINVGRVLLGGLLAGLVLNIGEYLANAVLFARQIEDSMRALNLPTASGSFIALAVTVTFVLGIAMVFLYAAIRPRFGPGIKTAVIAGLMVWLLAYAYNSVLNVGLGIFPLNLTLIGLVWGLVEAPLAAVVGAWAYKEEESEARVSDAYQQRGA